MSMIECPECKKEISSEAISCPHCGYPLRPTKIEIKSTYNGGLGVVTFIFAILTVLMIFTGGISLILPIIVLSVIALLLGIIDIIASRRLRLLNALGLFVYVALIGLVILFYATR